MRRSIAFRHGRARRRTLPGSHRPCSRSTAAASSTSSATSGSPSTRSRTAWRSSASRAPIPNLLERAVAFGEHLARLLDEAGDDLEVCHFRDPWSGVPILERPHRYATVFEVNALPSIELPYAFPSIAPRTLEKIRAAESFCLDAADRIVTPSRTTRDFLAKRGVPLSKIDVVPNGADPVPRLPRPFEAPDAYLIYFGALQSWQGVDTLLRAFARLADLEELRLVVCGSARSRPARAAEKLAAKLGLGERVLWRWELPQSELEPWLSNALLSVAPLRACSRNVEQGCAPLKVLESLAAGVPVVASDLPPVREIVTDGVEGRLVAPDRPAELARAIRLLLHVPGLREEMARPRAREGRKGALLGPFRRPPQGRLPLAAARRGGIIRHEPDRGGRACSRLSRRSGRSRLSRRRFWRRSRSPASTSPGVSSTSSGRSPSTTG